jgi:hypothetical protein
MSGRHLWILFSVFTLTACSVESAPDTSNKTAINPFKVHSDENLSVTPNSLSGRARIQFENPLLGTNSRENYSIAFRFLNDSASLIIHSHFSGFDQDDGVKLEFTQNDQRLFVSFSTPGYLETEAMELFKVIPNQQIHLKVEVHDGVSAGVRVLIWNDRLSQQGEVIRTQDQIFLGNHTLDSFENRLSFLSHGKGVFWGVELINVELIKAYRSAPYVD